MRDLPYHHTPSRKDKERQFVRFQDIFRKLHINIPLAKALKQMHMYAKFIKKLLTKKRIFIKEETIEFEASCSASFINPCLSNPRIQKVLPFQ